LEPYTLHITLYDAALFGMLFVSAAFILLLWFSGRANRTANRFLASALAIAMLGLGRVLAINLGLVGYLCVPLQFTLAFGPLIYFYVLITIRPGYQFRRKDLLHFSPLLLELSVQGSGITRSLKTATLALNVLAFVSVLVYLYLCRNTIDNFYTKKTFNNGDRYRHQLRWLLNLITAFGLLWILWIPLVVTDYFWYGNSLGAEVYYPLYLLLIGLLIWMAARIFIMPEVGTVAEAVPLLKPLLPAELKEKGIWLKHQVKQNHYYLDPDLSLASLAEKLGLHTHEVSRILNTVLKKSFNDFINEYRVQSAARMMQDAAYDHITLLGIAYESGFNSQSSFNRIFKQLTGKSPQEYKNSLKKEQPSYNLGSRPAFAPVILNRDSPAKWAYDKLTRNYMIRNYLKIAKRNLLHNKAYAAINITGLAVGIAVCLVIFIIIQYQTSFDNFHSKKDRVYRMLTEYHHAETGTVSYGKDLAFPIPKGLKTEFPQMEVAPIFASQNDHLIIPDSNGSPKKIFKEQRGLFITSASFFKMFDFPLLAGSYASLNDPNNIFLTKETAEKYFGDWKTAMGKTMKIQVGGYMFEHGTDVVRVSGILASIPANSDFQLKVVVSYGTAFTGDYLSQNTEWDETVIDYGCYVMLPPNTTANSFNEQLNTYSRKVESPDNKDSHILQPLSAVHYDTQVGNYSNKTISRSLLNVLWLIAAFILLIACVNFINLSTAQAVNRAKEVGVRKVLGSSKGQLQAQFIVETFLIVMGAVLLAVVVAIFALPSVGRLLDLSLSFNIFSNPAIIIFLVGVLVIVTALAGFYPAIVLSRFNPVNALKSKLTGNPAKGISLRRGLVVGQFVIAQALIIGTIVIVRQMDYFMNQPLGFDKEAVINAPFRVDSVSMSKMEYAKNRLLALNNVKAVTFSSNTPIENGDDTWSALKYDHAQKESGFKAITKFADDDYVRTYKLTLIAGRDLKPSGLTREFLVNESLLKSLGIKNPEDILNKQISIWGDRITCPVVGVVKDFNDRSFRDKLAPLLITTNGTMYNQAGIKLATGNLPATIESVKAIWEQTFPDMVFEYKFLDEKIGNFYKQENQLSQLYKLFSAIAIFLSCLGLYGLASFMAVQRIKEVGIRKVLGASAGSIVYLFSKEFIILIAIAFTIAAPIAWYYMHQWLQDYVYRINISWWLFAAGGLAAIIIALATISFQAVKAAMANPVRSLRSE
jgi:putative ABC transport system permease protein